MKSKLFFTFILLFLCLNLVNSADYRGYYDSVEQNSVQFRDVFSPQVVLENKTLSNTSAILDFNISDYSTIDESFAYLYHFDDLKNSNTIDGLTNFSGQMVANSEVEFIDTVPTNSYIIDSSFSLEVKNPDNVNITIQVANQTIFHKSNIGSETQFSNGVDLVSQLTLNEQALGDDLFYIKVPKGAKINNFSLKVEPQKGGLKLKSPQDIVYLDNILYLYDSIDKVLYKINVTNWNNLDILDKFTSDYPNLMDLPALLSNSSSRVVLADSGDNKTFNINQNFNEYTIQNYNYSPILERDFNEYKVVLDKSNAQIRFLNQTTFETESFVSSKSGNDFKYVSSFEIYTLNSLDYLVILDSIRNELIVFTRDSSSTNISEFEYAQSFTTFSDGLTLNSIFDIDYFGGFVYVSDSYNNRVIRLDAETFNYIDQVNVTRVKGIDVFMQGANTYLATTSFYDKLEVFELTGGNLVDFQSITQIGEYLPSALKIDIGDDFYGQSPVSQANFVEFIHNEYNLNDTYYFKTADEISMMNISNTSSDKYINDSKLVSSLNTQIDECNPISWEYNSLVSEYYSLDYSKLYELGILSDFKYIEDYCIIPVRVYSDSPGQFNISDFNLGYNYSINLTYYTNLFNENQKTDDSKIKIINSNNNPLDIDFTFETNYVDNFTQFASQDYNGLKRFNLTSFPKTGDYYLTVFSNDSTSNLGYGRAFFDISTRLLLKQSLSNPYLKLDLKIKSPESKEVLVDDLEVDGVDSLETEISNRTLDLDTSLEIVDRNDVSLTHYIRIEFQNSSFLNITNNTIENPLNFSDFNNVNSQLPTTDGVVFFSVDADKLAFDLATIVINYSPEYEQAIQDGNPLDENNLVLYKCPYFDPNDCSESDWVKLTPYLVDIVSKLAYFTTLNMSSYIFVADDSQSQTGSSSSSSSSSSGGSSSSGSSSGSGSGSSSGGGSSSSSSSSSSSKSTSNKVAGNPIVNPPKVQDLEDLYKQKAFCGDNICDLNLGESPITCRKDCDPHTLLYLTCGNFVCDNGENIQNCAEDCLEFPFGYYTNYLSPMILKGSDKEVDYYLLSRLNKSTNYTFGVSNNLKQYIEFTEDSIYLEPNETQKLSFKVNIPNSSALGLVSGDILIYSKSGGTKSIPFAINIVNESPILINLELNDNTISNEELLFKFTVENEQSTSYYSNIRYVVELEESNNQSFTYYKQFNESLVVENGYVYNRDFDLYSIENGSYLVDGKYRLTMFLETGSYNIAESIIFEYKESFWTDARKTYAALLFLLLLLLYGLYYAWKRYRAYAFANSKYIIPELAKLPKKGERSIWLGTVGGTNKPAYLNVDDLLTHALVAGSTGAGKSVTSSILVEEVLDKNIPVVVFDPTAQWTGFLGSNKDEKILKFFSKFNMTENDVKSYKGIIYDVKDPNIELDFKDYMNPGEITVFNLNSLKSGQYDIAVQKIVDTIFRMTWEESPEMKMFIVFDEVHRLLEKYGGSGGYVALEKAVREFRKWGIGMLMVSQVSADFKEALQGNVLTELQLNTKSMADINKAKSKYGDVYAERITRMNIGTGLIQNPHYNEGRPWFVNVRPPVHDPHKLSDELLDKYTKYSEYLKEVTKVVDSLKASGQDVGDIAMDLKLAKNKLKEGRFRMVEIYMESLQKFMESHKK